jgi:adenylate cyclase
LPKFSAACTNPKILKDDSPMDEEAFVFGAFRLLPAQRILLEDGKPLHLGSRALDLLVALVERAGDTIHKDKLIARVWPDTFVDEGNLKFQVSALRKALGDGRGGNRFIANIPGRGYSFVAPVRRVAPVGAADAITASARPVAQKPSIAVLPFANMSGDAEQEYFSEGITEDIITNLSRNRAFFVISRSASFTYKGPAVDVGKVARELRVRYVLEGSVRRAGSRVRITAQLIDAETGHHLWADRYDRELADVFAVQDEIAQSITGAISPGIITAEIQHAQRREPSQLDAWDRTMRAHWHIRRFTQSDLAEARRLLDEAIVLDPSNSMALSDLAFARHFEAVFGWGDGPTESHARLGEAARKAVAADDGDAMAHTSLAIFDLFSGRHEEARRRLRRALDLDPNSMFARGYLGGSYAFGGDYDAALSNLDEALRLCPRGPLLIIWHLCKGWAALLAGHDEEAVEYATQAAEANPEFPDIYAVLASANGHLGKASPARAALDQLSRRMPDLTVDDERLSRPFDRAGDRERFLTGLRKAGLPEG